MRTTRVFKSGDGQAAATPDDIAFEDDEELTIARHGDVVTISPVLARVGMAETVAKLRAMPKPSRTAQRRIRLPTPDSILRRERLDSLLKSLPVISFDAAAALAYRGILAMTE